MFPQSPIMAALFVVVALGIGCTSESNSLPADPVASYRQFLDQEFERIKTTVPQFAIDSKYKLDVQKTDSLVSPIAGTCVVDIIYPYQDSGKDAVIEKDAVILFIVNLEMKHGLQDGQWQLISGRGHITKSKVLKGPTAYPAAEDFAKNYMEGFRFSFESLDELKKIF